MAKRTPYRYQDRTWPEIANIRERSEVDGDVIPRSEFDQPYLKNNDEDDTYQSYEEDFPDPIWPGPIPDPVPIPGPCDAEDGCGFVTLVDVPETVPCGEEYWFRTIHEVHGCEPASFEDAFLVWEITAGDIINTTPPGMKWKAPECCDGQEVHVTVSSIDGSCSSTRTFRLECDVCCPAFQVTGADTVNPGTTWTGTISPNCPGASCTVTSNSGCPMTCTVSPQGASVSVPVGAKNCGSFTVTVKDENIDDITLVPCPETASKTVRINNTGQGGGWVSCYSQTFFLCNGPFCHCDIFSGEIWIRVWRGAGIFCGFCFNVNCTYDSPPITIPIGTICANSCSPTVPCTGSLWGIGAYIWADTSCPCI